MRLSVTLLVGVAIIVAVAAATGTLLLAFPETALAEEAVSAVGATVNVQPSVLAPQTPEVTVTVQIPIASNGWVIHRFFPQGTLSRSCTLSRERTEEN